MEHRILENTIITCIDKGDMLRNTNFSFWNNIHDSMEMVNVELDPF